MLKLNKIRCFIGMGSNLKDPIFQIKTAIAELKELPKTQFIQVSNLYPSSPLGPQDQPDFINAVAEIKTALAALDLLHELQRIEKNHHRKRDIRWGPRTLDLDILLYGDEIINTPLLTIPHPGLMIREFVLRPLIEIAPDLRLADGTLLRAFSFASSIDVEEL